jgi:hypothetical protein
METVLIVSLHRRRTQRAPANFFFSGHADSKAQEKKDPIFVRRAGEAGVNELQDAKCNGIAALLVRLAQDVGVDLCIQRLFRPILSKASLKGVENLEWKGRKMKRSRNKKAKRNDEI